jgi:TRAP-type C4-dicarboxylate transport system permease small subunit
MSPEGSKDSTRPARGWGHPLARFDASWTKFETWLASGILLAEVLALCAWIALKGLSAEYQLGGQGDKNVSGLVFRALLGAIVLGLAALRLTRPKVPEGDPAHGRAVARQNVIVTVAVVVGLAAGRLWVNGGVEYFANLLNWMQSASLLILIGGLRGVVTRLTLWLALLGASLATANGKHINIDVVMRFLTPKMRIPVAILGWVAAAVMCTAGAWGFFDHIAVALFHVRPVAHCAESADKTGQCPTTASQKLAHVVHDMGTDWFVVGRQLSLDLRSLPRVVAGTNYYGYLTASDWNAWVDGGDWAAHFPAEQVKGLRAPVDRPSDPHIPAVSIPGGQEVRGLLIKEADLIFPFGLLMIALRFILRSLLAISGQIEVDPDSAHKQEGESEGKGNEGDAPPPAAAVEEG